MFVYMVIILENKVTIFRKLMSVRMTFHHRSGVTNEPRVLAGEQQHLIRRRVASCQPFLSQTESVMRDGVRYGHGQPFTNKQIPYL